MANTPGPGLPRQSGVRTTARVVSIVLLLLAVFCGWHAVTGIQQAMEDGPDNGPAPILWFAGAGFSLVLALAAANVGWMGAGARYAAGETMPVVKDSAAYLSDGRGILGVGRTEGAAFCSECGATLTSGGKFCPSCGHAV